MATPIYKGQGQPIASSSWFGGLGSWFGGVSTPTYAGKGQPSAATSGYLAGSASAYKPAPVTPSPAPTPATVAASTAPANTAPAGAAQAAPTDPAMTPADDPCAMGIPSFALVIPRGALDP